MKKLGKFLGTGALWITGAMLAIWAGAVGLQTVHTAFPTPDNTANFGLFAAVENLNTDVQLNMIQKTVVSNNAVSQVSLTSGYNIYAGTNYGSQAIIIPAGVDSQEITYYTQAAIASSVVWTSPGASVIGAPSTLAANGHTKFKYDAGTTSWYTIDQ